MSVAAHVSPRFDFRGLDFDRLWKGRPKTTEVERRLVHESLQGRDVRRVLEVGPGGGRITSTLLETVPEFVGVDITLEFLIRLRARWQREATWVAADLARLPIGSRSFTGAVLVRVYNFLLEPAASLRELFRVLAPGGWLLVSYFPEPSVAALWSDLRQRLREPNAPRTRPRVPRPNPSAQPTRAQFREIIETVGFQWDREYSVGLEDLRPLRWLPTSLFLSCARTFGATGLLPHHFVLLRKPGKPPPRLPSIGSVVLCPGCRSPVAGLGAEEFPGSSCPGCGRELPSVEGVRDLRPILLTRNEFPSESVRVLAPGQTPSGAAISLATGRGRSVPLQPRHRTPGRKQAERDRGQQTPLVGGDTRGGEGEVFDQVVEKLHP